VLAFVSLSDLFLTGILANFDEEIRLVAIQSLVSLTDSEWKPPGIAAEGTYYHLCRSEMLNHGCS